jgi:hypothetical protein
VRTTFAAIALFVVASSPVLAATKVTVKQLDEFLAQQQRLSKSDDATATKLKDMVLTEQLTTASAKSLSTYEPGKNTATEIRVLALSSALLPPPPADLPELPAPSHAAHAAILARAVDYASNQYAHLPMLTAEKVTSRFQNGVDYVQTNSSTAGNFAGGSLELRPSDQYMRFMGQHTATVQMEGGIELPPAKIKKGDPASPTGLASQNGAGPVLGIILMDAARGKLFWQRWQKVENKQVAVFGYQVDEKHSQYKVNYCCFPVRENVGAHMLNSASGTSNQGTAVTFVPFKASPAYHGEIFVDPETGTIVRLIVQAELKPTDLVHEEDVRIDYGTVEVGGKPYVVPVRSMILTEVVPNGDSYVKYSTRRTWFGVEYTDYKERLLR